MPRATMAPMLPTDNHVHTRWSWDTAAFTEHLDVTDAHHKFALAVDIVEAAGFTPGRDRHDFWRR